jgi:hypothetical protein
MKTIVKEMHSAAMNVLLKETRHKKFFTQKEYEQNKVYIDEIYRCGNNLSKHIAQ